MRHRELPASNGCYLLLEANPTHFRPDVEPSRVIAAFVAILEEEMTERQATYRLSPYYSLDLLNSEIGRPVTYSYSSGVGEYSHQFPNVWIITFLSSNEHRHVAEMDLRELVGKVNRRLSHKPAHDERIIASDPHLLERALSFYHETRAGRVSWRDPSTASATGARAAGDGEGGASAGASAAAWPVAAAPAAAAMPRAEASAAAWLVAAAPAAAAMPRAEASAAAGPVAAAPAAASAAARSLAALSLFPTFAASGRGHHRGEAGEGDGGDPEIKVHAQWFYIDCSDMPSREGRAALENVANSYLSETDGTVTEAIASADEKGIYVCTSDEIKMDTQTPALARKIMVPSLVRELDQSIQAYKEGKSIDGTPGPCPKITSFRGIFTFQKPHQHGDRLEEAYELVAQARQTRSNEEILALVRNHAGSKPADCDYRLKSHLQTFLSRHSSPMATATAASAISVSGGEGGGGGGGGGAAAAVDRGTVRRGRPGPGARASATAASRTGAVPPMATADASIAPSRK